MKENPLVTWMKKTDETHQSLAQKIGCSIGFIACLRRGEITNSMEYMYKLEKLSKEKETGKSSVTIKSLIAYQKASNKVKSTNETSAEEESDD